MNTNAKHTPGPWKVDGDFEITDRNHVLASIYNTLAPEPMASEARANARLIAAAPVLAEYLAELLEATETLARRHGTPLPQCHQYAKAALAKATRGEG